MAKSRLVKTNEKIAETVTNAYKGIEDGVVGTYKKVESSVVEKYKKIEDGFVDKYLTHEGESIEDAKKRIAGEQTRA